MFFFMNRIYEDKKTASTDTLPNLWSVAFFFLRRKKNFDTHKIKRAVRLSIPLKFNTHNIARKEATFNLLHGEAASKLVHVADHAL